MFDTKKEEMELQEALVEVRKKKLKKRIIVISIVSVVLLAIIGAIWISGYSCAKSKADQKIAELEEKIKELTETPVMLEPVTPEIIQKVLASKMTEISELATAEYIFTNAAKFSDTKHIAVLPDSWTQKSFVQKWNGVIKAGIKLDEVVVTSKDKVITITLPYAEILSYEVDKNSVEILDEKNNVFNPISVNDKVNFDRETSYAMKARAVENGLLLKAQKNAEITISALLRDSIEGFEEYTLEFVTVDK